MTTPPAITAVLGELLPRHLFLEPLLFGARVLELGALEIAGGASATALHDRGAASVVSLGRDPEAVETARREHGGPGLRFDGGPIGALAAAFFDLVVVHDPSWLEETDELVRVIAPGGRLAVAARGDDGYRAVASALSARFQSVEVATIRAVAGWAVAPVQVAGAALSVEELGDEGAPASRFLFVGGRSPTRIATQRLVVLPPPAGLEDLLLEGASLRADYDSIRDQADSLRSENDGLREQAGSLRSENDGLREQADSLRSENDELRAQADSLRSENDALHAQADSLRSDNDALLAQADSLRTEGATNGVLVDDLRTENERLRAELEPLRDRLKEADLQGDELAALEAEAARARASARELRDELASLHAGAAPDLPFERTGGWDSSDDALARRARDAEERAEFAKLRAREAEDSMRAAQRRAEAAEGERADALIAARRMLLDAERTRREGAGPVLAERRPLRRG